MTMLMQRTMEMMGHPLDLTATSYPALSGRSPYKHGQPRFRSRTIVRNEAVRLSEARYGYRKIGQTAPMLTSLEARELVHCPWAATPLSGLQGKMTLSLVHCS